MSLLQGVLRSNAADLATVDKKLKAMNILPSTSSTVSDKDDSDDDLVNVVSAGSLKPASNTNQHRSLFLEHRIALDHRHRSEVPQPDHFAARCIFHLGAILSKHFPPKYLKKFSPTFPYAISRNVHSFRGNGARAKLSTMVRSPPPIGPQGAHHSPVWFQHYRKDNFRDDSLPPGKWTKRESKQDWVCFARHHLFRLTADYPLARHPPALGR